MHDLLHTFQGVDPCTLIVTNNGSLYEPAQMQTYQIKIQLLYSNMKIEVKSYGHLNDL
jgi:hypothetical protein